MKIYYWMDEEHENEFDVVPETEDNCIGLEPKANTTAEGIRDYYLFLILCADQKGEIQYNPKKLSNEIIERFKSSKCFVEKTEADRQAIIEFIKKNPGTTPYSSNTVVDF